MVSFWVCLLLVSIAFGKPNGPLEKDQIQNGHKEEDPIPNGHQEKDQLQMRLQSIRRLSNDDHSARTRGTVFSRKEVIETLMSLYRLFGRLVGFPITALAQLSSTLRSSAVYPVL